MSESATASQSETRVWRMRPMAYAPVAFLLIPIFGIGAGALAYWTTHQPHEPDRGAYFAVSLCVLSPAYGIFIWYLLGRQIIASVLLTPTNVICKSLRGRWTLERPVQIERDGQHLILTDRNGQKFALGRGAYGKSFDEFVRAVEEDARVSETG